MSRAWGTRTLEANGGAEQLGGLVDGKQLFHDRALGGARWGSATFGCFTMSTEHQGHRRARWRDGSRMKQRRNDADTDQCCPTIEGPDRPPESLPQRREPCAPHSFPNGNDPWCDLRWLT